MVHGGEEEIDHKGYIMLWAVGRGEVEGGTWAVDGAVRWWQVESGQLVVL